MKTQYRSFAFRSAKPGNDFPRQGATRRICHILSNDISVSKGKILYTKNVIYFRVAVKAWLQCIYIINVIWSRFRNAHNFAEIWIFWTIFWYYWFVHIRMMKIKYPRARCFEVPRKIGHFIRRDCSISFQNIFYKWCSCIS